MNFYDLMKLAMENHAPSWSVADDLKVAGRVMERARLDGQPMTEEDRHLAALARDVARKKGWQTPEIERAIEEGKEEIRRNQ